MERTAFLSRVRERLRNVDAPELPREWPPTPASAPAGRDLDHMCEELERLGATARIVETAEVARAVTESARAVAATTAVISGDIGPYEGDVRRGLADAGVTSVELTGDEEADGRDACATADVGITGAVAGVASTGSVLVAASPSASRLASLLPPAHIAVLPADRVVAGFEELFTALSDYLGDSSGASLVTGPSRTADIEMTLVRGVHGPADVHVIVVR